MARYKFSEYLKLSRISIADIPVLHSTAFSFAQQLIFKVGRHRTRSIMRKLKLVVKQRQAYKFTTKRKHSDSVADNLLTQQFNPAQANLVRAGDVTYLRTNQGWMYLAIVMDLYSRRVVGWSISKRMTVDLVERALQMAINIRRPKAGFNVP